MAIENGRSLSGVVSDLKEELKDFLQTRVEMFRSEMKDRLSAYKTAVPMLAIAVFVGLTAWFVLTGALITIIARGFYPSKYDYFFGLVIVGVVYALVAVVIGAFAMREIKEHGLMPKRTIEVLKQDQVWLKTEARQQA